MSRQERAWPEDAWRIVSVRTLQARRAVWSAAAVIGVIWAVAGGYPGAGGLWMSAAAQQARPIINVAPVTLVEPASNAPLAIQVAPSDASLKNSFLRIRGLPPAAALSEGHAIGPGAWAVPLITLPTLNIVVPTGLQGRWTVAIALVNLDGTVQAEAQTALVIAPAQLIAGSQSSQEGRQASANIASVGSTTPPVASPEREHALSMHAKGQEQLERGNVQPARLYFQRAAEAGLAQSALALGATYDPEELVKLKVVGLQPDLAAARRWYEKARELGAAEAADRLRRLANQ